MEDKIIGFIENNRLNEKSFNLIVDRLAASFNQPKKQIEKLLGQLKNDGEIIESKNSKLILSKKLGLIKGTVSGHSRGFAFVVPTKEGQEDIFIAPKNLKGAMHGDTVLAKVLTSPKSAKSEGEIYSVLTRGITTLVGTIEILKGYGFLVPDNNKYYSDIFIPKNKTLNAKNGQKVVVKILNYTKNSPEGEVIEVLGNSLEPAVEVLSIIRSYQLREEFSKEINTFAAGIDKKIKQEDLKNRTDLRQKNIITIDGIDAKDLDDAIDIEYNKETEIYTLGVHIADVGHYVKRGGIIDKEAFLRGTSVYFPHLTLPMLPRELSNGICSLHPNEDRLTLSVFMQINKSGQVIKYDICSSVINSKHRLTYDKVTQILEGSINPAYSEEQLFKDLYTMRDLSRILENMRKQRGSLDFDLPETKIVVEGEDLRVLELSPAPRQESHKIIESFMLCANETVARHIYELKLPFIYRIHEKPTQEKLQAFAEFIRGFGLSLKDDISKVRPKDLQIFLEKLEDKPYKNIINRVLLRSMQKAKYSPDCLGHYGLAAEYYSHFTSPIRRYPDLSIHRILKAHLNKEQNLVSSKLKKFTEEASLQSSITELQAEKCSREVDDYFKAKYMEDKIGEVYEGTISGVTAFGIFVELNNTVEGFVRLQDLKEDNYQFVEHKYLLKGTKNTYSLKDSVKVKVVSASRVDKRVDFVLI